MTLQERLKQLKTGADRQAAELGHEDAAGAAAAFGRVTGRALGNVVHDAGKMVLAFLPEDDSKPAHLKNGLLEDDLLENDLLENDLLENETIGGNRTYR